MAPFGPPYQPQGAYSGPSMPQNHYLTAAPISSMPGGNFSLTLELQERACVAHFREEAARNARYAAFRAGQVAQYHREMARRNEEEAQRQLRLAQEYERLPLGPQDGMGSASGHIPPNTNTIVTPGGPVNVMAVGQRGNNVQWAGFPPSMHQPIAHRPSPRQFQQFNVYEQVPRSPQQQGPVMNLSNSTRQEDTGNTGDPSAALEASNRQGQQEMNNQNDVAEEQEEVKEEEEWEEDYDY